MKVNLKSKICCPKNAGPFQMKVKIVFGLLIWYIISLIILEGCGCVSSPDIYRWEEKGDVTSLISALQDDNATVRWKAAEALGEIGDKRAVEPLISALQDDNATVREDAAWALGEIGDKRAVEPLISALQDWDATVRRNAAEALRKLAKTLGVAKIDIRINQALTSYRKIYK